MYQSESEQASGGSVRSSPAVWDVAKQALDLLRLPKETGGNF